MGVSPGPEAGVTQGMAEVVMRARNWVACGAVTALVSGCFVEEHRPPPAPPAETRIELDEVTNLGYACGGPMTAWTVSNRETGDSGTAGCEQPVLFVGLAPNASYTFDIQGYAGSKLCWSGTCGAVAAGYQTSFVDCSGQIQHLCGL
jgi:hypothetical protein